MFRIHADPDPQHWKKEHRIWRLIFQKAVQMVKIISSYIEVEKIPYNFQEKEVRHEFNLIPVPKYFIIDW